MKRIGLFLAILMAVGTSGARADLPDDIKTILKDKYLTKVDIGISVAKLGGAAETPVYRFESEIPLIPASNLKLLTTSAFLDRVGGDFKFRTVLLAKGQDVYLIGDGDPSMGDVELIKKGGWDANTVFKLWAADLKKRGITTVNNVFVDDSVFDQQFIPQHWLAKYSNARYSAQIAGVNLNANCIDFMVRATTPGQPVAYTMDPPTQYVSVKNNCLTGKGSAVGIVRNGGKNDWLLRGVVDSDLGEPVSMPVYDPPLFAATVLAETLASSGITVTGKVARDLQTQQHYAADPKGWTVAAAYETKIATVLARANKDSMNLYAECMCKRLGHEVTQKSGTWENGTAAVGDFVTRLGVPANQFHLDDGCGLSRENNVSADALVKVLSYDFANKNKEVFLSSLAVPGEEGTFKNRFKGTLKTRVYGKSGYVEGVSAVSGYLHGRDDNWYAFSILMNNCPYGTNNTAKEIQEKIVRAVDENLKE